MTTLKKSSGIARRKIMKTNSVYDTENFAENFASNLKAGQVVALYGGLGAGKTAFVRGLCRGIGYDGEVTSPTFAIIHEYTGGRLPIFHFDMYRIEGYLDLESTAFFEYLEKNGVTVIEWSENIENVLPDGTIKIRISNGEFENERLINIL